MKSLKKVLCLVLSLAMVLGMASFAFAYDYTLTSYQEATDVMTALGVFVGNGNGEFEWTDNLTREQAAKLVAYLVLGQEYADEESAREVFDDVNLESWAAGYISFCAQHGYINGYNDTTFGPKDLVTGDQFGKMLLCVLGYDAELEEFVGKDWAENVALYMDAVGLLDGIVLDLEEPLTREEAAQLCFNALISTMVQYNLIDEDAESAYQILAELKEVPNNNIAETIFNDDVFQLAEKLYPTLQLKMNEDSHTWVLNGVEIGTYDFVYLDYNEEVLEEIVDPEQDEYAKRSDRVYPLIGVKDIVESELRFFGKLPYVDKKLDIDAEDIVLFSKDGEKYSPFLLASPGEKVYVKANNFTINLLKQFGGYLPEKLSSNTELYEQNKENLAAELEKILGFDGRKNLFGYDLGINGVELLDDVLNQAVVGLVEKLTEESEKDFTIDLKLVEEAVNGQPAVYCFAMPDRVVSAYDFEAGYISTVTFVNATLLPKTIVLKVGELGEVQKIKLEPFSTETIEVEGNEAVYYTTLAKTRAVFDRVRPAGTKVVNQPFGILPCYFIKALAGNQVVTLTTF